MKVNEMSSGVNMMVSRDHKNGTKTNRTVCSQAKMEIYTIWDVPPGSWWDGESLAKRFGQVIMGWFK